jgi:type IV pilus assembly protein PilA
LMIVVAIIGILAAVAVPYYQRYVAKSRLTSLVFPGIHAIENSISTRYAVSNDMPTTRADLKASGGDPDGLAGDADLTYITSMGWTRSAAGTGFLTVTINNATTKFKALEDKNVFRALANSSGGKLYWTYAGTLSNEFGL